jgi:hypothetical protein
MVKAILSNKVLVFFNSKLVFKIELAILLKAVGLTLSKLLFNCSTVNLDCLNSLLNFPISS